MVQELYEIMEHCDNQAKEYEKVRYSCTDFEVKSLLSAKEEVYREIRDMARESLEKGGYLDEDD